MIIKVCGMREPHNIEQVAALGIDMMGFIFYPKSPRYVPLIFNSSFFIFNSISRVGVFVNESTDVILKTAALHTLDTIQLHGNESADQCLELRRRGFGVIKAISVSKADDIDIAKQYAPCCDWLLFDTKSAQHGGSGKQFDWQLLHLYQGETPFLLSGGITPQSVDKLQQFNHPQWAGIDLNSGFEIAPGQKDVVALQNFLQTLHL